MIEILENVILMLTTAILMVIGALIRDGKRGRK